MAELGRNWERESLGGGRYRLTQYQKPHCYQESGVWRRINDNWEDSGIPVCPHIVTKAPFMVSVGEDGMRRIHPTKELDRYVEIGAPYVKIGGEWAQVNLGKPARRGNLLKWTTDQANLYIRMAGHFIKLGILLKNGWEPPDGKFAFPVGLTGLTRDGGQIKADGVTVMCVSAPVVYDYDNPLDVRPVAWGFVQVGGQRYVVFTLPNLVGMSRPLIDPTLTIQPDAGDGLDTFILDNEPTTNYGTLNALYVGQINANSNIPRSLIKFDLSNLPADAIISSTTLSLYFANDYSDNARTFRVYRLKRAWVEAETTWNIYSTGNDWQTAGGFGADDCEQTDIGSRAFSATETLNEFKDFSLTPTTKAGLDLGNGWLIKADTEVDDGYSFYSSDEATAANRPKLVIVYSVGVPGRMLRGLVG